MIRRSVPALCAFLLLAAAPSAKSAERSLSFTMLREPSVRVLMFHQVTDHPIEPKHGVGTPWIAPAKFTALLTDLKARGYHFISMKTALAFLSGKLRTSQLPTKAVTLTFDDGYRSAWSIATPIMRRFGAPATMFFEGHATGVIPGRLTRGDLRAMAHSGMWSLQSHGFAGHSDVLVGPHGSESPYWYANLAWLPTLHRFETKPEFEIRIENDLKRFRSTFQPVTGAPITVFAYPSGEYGQNAALLPGANPATNSQAGHSNARGLTPLIFEALTEAGFTGAFSVYDPGHIHFAQRGDNIFALPRLGFAATSSVLTDLQMMQKLESSGIEYPEIAAGQYTAVGPIAIDGSRILVASTVEPLIFALNMSGRKTGSFRLPTLQNNRANAPTAIGGLAIDGRTLWIAQKAGSGAHPTPYLSSFRITSKGFYPLSRVALPHSMDWLVGIAHADGRFLGIDDGGQLFDLRTGREIAHLAHGAAYESNRFAGLASSAGLLFTFDSKKHRIIAVRPDGSVAEMGRIQGNLVSLAVHGAYLYASNSRNGRHSLRVYLIKRGAK